MKKPENIKISKLLWTFLGLLIIFFLIQKVLVYREQINYKLIKINFILLTAAIILLLTYYFYLGIIWVTILKEIGAKLKLKDGLRVFIMSQFAKYLPGGVWNYFGRVYMCNQSGIPSSIALYSVTIELIFTIFSGLLLLLPFSLWASFLEAFSENLILIIIIFITIMISFLLVARYHSILFRYIPKRIAKLIKPEGIKTLSPKAIISIIFYYLLSWVLLNASFFVFIKSLYPVPWKFFSYLFVAYPLSWITGFLGPTPGGIGVREGVLTYLLGFFVQPPIALIISLSSRVWMMVVEVLALLLAFICLRRGKTIENTRSGNDISEMER